MNFKFKAAVLHKVRKPLKIKELSMPKLSRGQVLVKIAYSGICGSQIMEIDGMRGKDKWLPHCLGHEASGEVLKIGENVKKIKKGEKVILTWLKCEGIESKNPTFLDYKTTVNSGKITTFSNYAIVSENRVVKKPKFLNMKEAVLYGCALPTGFGMVINEIIPRKQDKILLIGLGGIGMSVLIGLKAIRHKNVIIAEISDNKVSQAKRFGFKNAFNIRKINLKDKLIETFPEGIDICIETAGKIKTIEYGFSLIKEQGGKIFFASHPENGKKIKLNPHELIKGKCIYGSWGGKCNPDKDVPKIAQMIKKNRINLNLMMNKVYSLEKINIALSDMKKGKVIRPIVKMRHN